MNFNPMCKYIDVKKEETVKAAQFETWDYVHYVNEANSNINNDKSKVVSHILSGMEIVDVAVYVANVSSGEEIGTHEILCKRDNRYYLVSFEDAVKRFAIAEVECFEVEG